MIIILDGRKWSRLTRSCRRGEGCERPSTRGRGAKAQPIPSHRGEQEQEGEHLLLSEGIIIETARLI